MNRNGSDTRSIDELIAAQRPGYSLEQRFYTDPAIYELELERIINRNWVLAGHVSELPKPGDYKVFDVARESAIIVRGEDGEIRAFANVCRHRGSRVCLEAAGSARDLSCPYHGWKYHLDGRLKAARDMPGDFDFDAHGLHPSASASCTGSCSSASAARRPGSITAARTWPSRWRCSVSRT